MRRPQGTEPAIHESDLRPRRFQCNYIGHFAAQCYLRYDPNPPRNVYFSQERTNQGHLVSNVPLLRPTPTYTPQPEATTSQQQQAWQHQEQPQVQQQQHLHCEHRQEQSHPSHILTAQSALLVGSQCSGLGPELSLIHI